MFFMNWFMEKKNYFVQRLIIFYVKNIILNWAEFDEINRSLLLSIMCKYLLRHFFKIISPYYFDYFSNKLIFTFK